MPGDAAEQAAWPWGTAGTRSRPPDQAQHGRDGRAEPLGCGVHHTPSLTGPGLGVKTPSLSLARRRGVPYTQRRQFRSQSGHTPRL